LTDWSDQDAFSIKIGDIIFVHSPLPKSMVNDNEQIYGNTVSNIQLVI